MQMSKLLWSPKCPPRWLRAWYQVKTQFKVTKDLQATKQVDPPTALEW